MAFLPQRDSKDYTKEAQRNPNLKNNIIYCK